MCLQIGLAVGDIAEVREKASEKIAAMQVQITLVLWEVQVYVVG